MLDDLKKDAAPHQVPAPVADTAGKVPSSLATFDEGPTQISDTKAADAVTPEAPRRRRRRRGRGRRRSESSEKPGEPPTTTEAPPKDEDGR